MSSENVSGFIGWLVNPGEIRTIWPGEIFELFGAFMILWIVSWPSAIWIALLGILECLLKYHFYRTVFMFKSYRNCIFLMT